MSTLSIASYFPFCRVVVCAQNVSAEADLAVVDVRPDQRFRPICHRCGGSAARVCSHHVRAVRDPDFASTQVHLRLSYRKVFWAESERVVAEDLEIVEPWQRVTRRLARCIHELCKVMTLADVARHFGLDWKTLKNIDKALLEEHYGETDYEGLCILAVDKIAVKKSRRYMTVVIDYETGRVVWMGQGRSKESLGAFFDGMTKQQKEALEAISADVHEPYIGAVQEAAPHVKVTLHLFHVVTAYGKVIDRVRMGEYRKASRGDKALFKRAKYLLLKKRLDRPEHRAHLGRLLELNETLFYIYVLRDMLARILSYRYRAWAAKPLERWCDLARAVGHHELVRFARRLERHQEVILNHCNYLIHTSRL